MDRKITILLAVLAVLAIGAGGYAMTRGFRNKNPGNLKTAGTRNGIGGADPWRGLVGEDSDGFAIFQSTAYGIRAMQRTLDSYARRGLVSVGAIIGAWAPPSENQTASYARYVANALGVDVTEPAPDRVELIKAIIKFENGFNPYSDATILDGMRLA